MIQQPHKYIMYEKGLYNNLELVFAFERSLEVVVNPY